MVVDVFTAVFLIGMLLSIFATVKGKGHGLVLAIIATLIAAFTSPIAVLIVCLIFVPTKKGSFWDE